MAFPRCEGIHFCRGSRLNRDVGHKNNWLPHVQWTFHIDNAKKSDHTVTLKNNGPEQKSRKPNEQPNKAFHRTAHKAPPVNADVSLTEKEAHEEV